MADNKIFVYLRLQDEKETLLKSRIREFAALGKLLLDFIKQCWEQYGQWILKTGTLEYVDANTGIVLVAFRYDIIHSKIIISGVIPKDYKDRMLSFEETKTKFSTDEIMGHMAKSVIQQNFLQPIKFPNILSLIKKNINENGEYYIALNINQ